MKKNNKKLQQVSAILGLLMGIVLFVVFLALLLGTDPAGIYSKLDYWNTILSMHVQVGEYEQTLVATFNAVSNMLWNNRIVEIFAQLMMLFTVAIGLRMLYSPQLLEE